ncbi:MAG: hypothetical protein IJ796_10750, partial [Lachnospiraceae bacterium]|nr:hypothetical protein [Lachnospiraceae bacterium]
GNAIDDCISEGILADFLRRRRDEVTKSIMIDMRHETILEIEKQVARDEGIKVGREEGREEGEDNLLNIVLRLKSGADADILLKEGYSESTISKAKKIISV